MSKTLKKQELTFLVDYREGDIDSEQAIINTSRVSKWAKYETGFATGNMLGGSLTGYLYKLNDNYIPPTTPHTIIFMASINSKFIANWHEVFRYPLGALYFNQLKELIYYQYESGGGPRSSGVAIKDNNMHVFAFNFKSLTNLEFFVDGVKAGKSFNNITLPVGNGFFNVGGGADVGYSGGCYISLAAMTKDSLDDDTITKISQELLNKRPVLRGYDDKFKVKVQHKEEKGLVLHYNMDLTRDGKYIEDLSGNGNDGTFKGVRFIENEYPFNRVAEIKGGRGSISPKALLPMSSIPTLDITNKSFSYGGWFKRGKSGTQYLIAAYASKPIIFISVSNVGIGIRIDDGTTNFTDSYFCKDIMNEWFHVVCVVNREDNTCKLYLNGQEVKSINVTGLKEMTVSNFLFVGNYGFWVNPADIEPRLTVGEVKFYNDRALTAKEVKAWYNEVGLSLTYQTHPKKWQMSHGYITSGDIANTGVRSFINNIKIERGVSGEKTVISKSETSMYIIPMNDQTGTWVWKINRIGNARIYFNLDINYNNSSVKSGISLYSAGSAAVLLKEPSGVKITDLTKTLVGFVESLVAITINYDGRIDVYLNDTSTSGWEHIGGGVYDVAMPKSKYCGFSVKNYSGSNTSTARLVAKHLGVLTLEDLIKLYKF